MNLPDITLGHTPGIYYALGYFIASLIFLSVNKRKLNGWRLAGVSAFFLIALSAFMISTDGVTSWVFAVSMLAIFTMIFLFFLTAAEMSWKKALYFSLRAFIVGEFAASFEWQMYYYAVTGLKLPQTIWVGLLTLILNYAFVFSLLFLLERRYRTSNASLELGIRELITVFLMGLLIYGISNLSFALPESPFSSHNVAEIFALRTLTDLSGVWLLLAYHMQLCELRANMENEYLSKLLHMQEENYRISAETVQLVNQKYHDLKHQIRLLRSEISAEDKLAYLDEMEQEIRQYEALNKTGNEALDVLLSAKALQCQREGISLTCVADGKELSFMKAPDVSVLFGNALDNAIESAGRLTDPNKRLIHLSVSRERGFVRIRVENCFEGTLKFEDGLPQTTKKDARYHGYGIKSIRSVVEKYNGSLTVKGEDGWFELRILLPLN